MPPPWPVTVPRDKCGYFDTLESPSLPPSIDPAEFAASYVPISSQIRAGIIEIHQGIAFERASRQLARLNAVAKAPAFNWTLVIFRSQANFAFTVPDGSLFVSDGLIASLSDSELAAEVAHLIAHVRYQHARDTASTWTTAEAKTRTEWQAAASLAVASIGRVAPSGVNETPPLGSLYLGRLAMNGYSREQETEANFLAAKYLRQIGIPPDALFDAMALLSTKGGGNKSIRFADFHRATQSASDFGRMLDAGLIK